MLLHDVITPALPVPRRGSGAEQYGSLLDLLLSDPMVSAWLEADDDPYELDVAHEESLGS
jgi:hypothetical protein